MYLKDPLIYADQEYLSESEAHDVKDELECEELNNSTRSMDCSPTYEFLETEEVADDAEDTAWENESDDENEDDDEVSLGDSNDR